MVNTLILIMSAFCLLACFKPLLEYLGGFHKMQASTHPLKQERRVS